MEPVGSAPVAGTGRRAARVGLVLLSLLLVAEVGVRTVTYLAWKRPLWRHPEIAERLEQSAGMMKRLTLDVVLGPPESLPAPLFKGGSGRSAPEWTTFGALEASAFVRPPKTEQAPAGVVRVAFLGGSTTFDGYPDEVGRLLDSTFGPGRVEIVNLGVPASHLRTTLVLAEKFLPRWRPHLVVAYHGFNDLVFSNAYVVAQSSGRDGLGAPVDAAFRPARQRGLLDLFRGPVDVFEALPAWARDGVVEHPMEGYWRLSGLAYGLGASLFVSTFAAPDYATLAAADLDYYETELQYLWPFLGSTARYATTLGRYNARLTSLASSAGVALVDVAGGVRGGRETFRDNCHLTDDGRRRHASIVARALEPQLRALLDAGAPPPVSRPLPESPKPLPVPAEGFPAVFADRGCLRGPCPEGACFVPGGRATYGYDEAFVTARVLPRMKAATGQADVSFFRDDMPPVEVEVSPFCLDQAEATWRDLAKCRDAGVCAPHRPVGRVDEERVPAMVPTADDALRFCGFRGGRLPTDVEWEYAARGPKGRPMPWGDADWSGREANFCGRECALGARSDPDDGHVGPAPIGLFASTAGMDPFGHVDLAGNLWEWVDDCFIEASHPLLAGTRDPVVRTSPCRRFLRGGSFASLPGILERRNFEGIADVLPESRGVRCSFDFGVSRTEMTPVDPRGGR